MADPVTKERATANKRTRYEKDYYGWALEQVALLRSGRVQEVEAENVAEELEGLANDEFAKLESSLRVLLMHMLKWISSPSIGPEAGFSPYENSGGVMCEF
jgi:hypothetical protein